MKDGPSNGSPVIRYQTVLPFIFFLLGNTICFRVQLLSAHGWKPGDMQVGTCGHERFHVREGDSESTAIPTSRECVQLAYNGFAAFDGPFRKGPSKGP
jgi:hypothetical protein